MDVDAIIAGMTEAQKRAVIAEIERVIDAVPSPYDQHRDAPENCAFCDGCDAAFEAVRARLEVDNG